MGDRLVWSYIHAQCEYMDCTKKEQFACKWPAKNGSVRAEGQSPHGLMKEFVTEHTAAMQVCCSQQGCLLNGMIILPYVYSSCPPALFKTNKKTPIKLKAQ